MEWNFMEINLRLVVYLEQKHNLPSRHKAPRNIVRVYRLSLPIGGTTFLRYDLFTSTCICVPVISVKYFVCGSRAKIDTLVDFKLEALVNYLNTHLERHRKDKDIMAQRMKEVADIV